MTNDELLETVIESLSIRLTDLEAARSLCAPGSWHWEANHTKAVKVEEALNHYTPLR